MKIKITDTMKKVLTLDEMPAVRKIISDMKEISNTEFLKDADRAVSLATENISRNGIRPCFEILKAEAEICKNSNAWNYFEDGYNIDIWISAYAFDRLYGFCLVEFYLSDFWQLAGDTNRGEIRERMYVRRCPFEEN